MGCNQSKSSSGATVRGRARDGAPSPPAKNSASSSNSGKSPDASPPPPPSSSSALYDLLRSDGVGPTVDGWERVRTLCESDPSLASYRDEDTAATESSTASLSSAASSSSSSPRWFGATPLHAACVNLGRIGGDGSANAARVSVAAATDALRSIVQACPSAVGTADGEGNVPLHYVFEQEKGGGDDEIPPPSPAANAARAAAVRLLAEIDTKRDVCRSYLGFDDVEYGRSRIAKGGRGGGGGGCTPLYRAVEMLSDDGTTEGAASALDFVKAVRDAGPPGVAFVPNASDEDKPLALLYRRFVRQFDMSEKFFPGDNSREEVVHHRSKYTSAAEATFRIIELLLRPAPQGEGEANCDSTLGDRWIVHNAVRVECPPDLLRYIVETHADQVRDADSGGNLPLHRAASAVPPDGSPPYPAYLSKFVVDELLYAHPDAASVPNKAGKFPITLAVEAGKTWIGGGVKSLYDANPESMEQVELKEYPMIHEAMSIMSQMQGVEVDEDGDDEEGVGDSAGGAERGRSVIQKEEHHDAIMLVQRPDVGVSDIVSAMWANEEDGGVQMLGCVAISKMASEAVEVAGSGDCGGVERIALSGATAVVNAMKNHPNEPAVQEKACRALRTLSDADRRREVSFAASGAVSAIVGSMQAHVGDAIVQEEACAALRNIVARGGSERATVVASVSGFTAIVNALGAHPGVAGVQREACRALEVLTGFPDANLPELPGVQTAPLLQAAAAKFPDECKDAADVVLTRLS